MEEIIEFHFNEYETCKLKHGDECPQPHCTCCAIILEDQKPVRFECHRNKYNH